jgi:trk system potassium uptake protein TrkH
MPTGGFTATNLSIQSFNSPLVEGIVIFFMVIAGVNFGLFYFLIWKRQLRQVLKSAEFRVYLGLLAGVTILIALDLWRNMGISFGEAARLGGFQVVSIMTTTGFASADFNLWPAFARTALLLLMAIGASAGSTGGALKVIRLMVLVKYSYNQIVHAFNPKAVLPLKLGGNTVPPAVVSRIIGMSVLYFLTLLGGFLVMTAILGPGIERAMGPEAATETVRAVTLETALSSVVSAVGNVGPGLGLVGPVENYMFVPPLGKAVLMVCMVVGRLELLTIMMLFLPVFWRWR